MTIQTISKNDTFC